MGCRPAIVESNLQEGRPRKLKAQTLWDAAQYVTTTGCQWAQLPKDLPPFTTLQYHFYPIHDHGLLDVVKLVVVAWLRVSEGRKPASTGALPSFDYAQKPVGENHRGGWPRGYDAGKTITGASGTS